MIKVFKTINADATKFSNRLGILHRSYSDIITDFKTLGASSGGIKNFKHIFNLATKQDIQNFEQFKTAINNGLNAQRTYDTYLASAPSKMRQVGQEIVNIKNQQYELTTSYNQGKISLDDYNNQMRISNARLNELQNTTSLLDSFPLCHDRNLTRNHEVA